MMMLKVGSSPSYRHESLVRRLQVLDVHCLKALAHVTLEALQISARGVLRMVALP